MLRSHRPAAGPERPPAWRHCPGGGGGNGDGPPCGGGADGGRCAVLVREAEPGGGLRLWIALGGGGTGCNTTCTGLGTSVGGGLSQKECGGGSPVDTWMVCGMKPILVRVTAWGSEGTPTAQGVRQVWPLVVRTSAPAGSDSKRNDCICAPAGFDCIQSGVQSGIAGIAEQPASATPMTATAAATATLMPDMALSIPNGQP